MAFREVMDELRACGTEQNRKIYRRHGVQGELYGVSSANLEKLRKRIKTDHALAQQLWQSGNGDARNLATMIADPAQATPEMLEEWVSGLDSYVITDAFVRHLAGKNPHARKKAET